MSYFEEIFNENAKQDIKTMESYMIKVYSHMIKYYSQPNRQSKSWVTSIFLGRSEIINDGKNKNILNFIINKNKTIIIDSYKLASAETDIPINKLMTTFADKEEILTFQSVVTPGILETFTRNYFSGKGYLSLEILEATIKNYTK